MSKAPLPREWGVRGGGPLGARPNGISSLAAIIPAQAEICFICRKCPACAGMA